MVGATLQDMNGAMHELSSSLHTRRQSPIPVTELRGMQTSSPTADSRTTWPHEHVATRWHVANSSGSRANVSRRFDTQLVSAASRARVTEHATLGRCLAAASHGAAARAAAHALPPSTPQMKPVIARRSSMATLRGCGINMAPLRACCLRQGASERAASDGRLR